MDDFGGRLRQARERRGLSLRQIAASTKIAVAPLEALERNDISKLPGGIFSRAFVRSYAIEVGLDPDETVREFLERFGQEPPPASEAAGAAIPEEEREFQERQRRAARAAIAGLAVLIVLVVVAVLAYKTRVRARAAQQPQVTQDAVPPSLQPAATRSVAAATPAVSVDAGQPSSPAPLTVERRAPVSSAQLRLEIQPTGECWVSVTADGTRVFARMMAAGQTESVTIAREATVEVGDAGAFAYRVNGKPGKPLGDKGQVKTLTLTPATAAQYTR